MITLCRQVNCTFCLMHIGHRPLDEAEQAKQQHQREKRRKDRVRKQRQRAHAPAAAHAHVRMDMDMFAEIAADINNANLHIETCIKRINNAAAATAADNTSDDDCSVVHAEMYKAEQQAQSAEQRVVFYYNNSATVVNAMGIQLLSQKYFMHTFGTRLLAVDVRRHVSKHKLHLITLYTMCSNANGYFKELILHILFLMTNSRRLASRTTHNKHTDRRVLHKKKEPHCVRVRCAVCV